MIDPTFDKGFDFYWARLDNDKKEIAAYYLIDILNTGLAQINCMAPCDQVTNATDTFNDWIATMTPFIPGSPPSGGS